MASTIKPIMLGVSYGTLFFVLAFIIFNIFFGEVDNGLTVTQPNVFKSENGIQFEKDCFDGREFFIVQYPSHFAMMASTGRLC